MQKELADANSVAEEVLSSMTTVRAHAAENSACAAYRSCLRKFYTLQVWHHPCLMFFTAACKSSRKCSDMHATAFCIWTVPSISTDNDVCAAVAVEGGPCIRHLHDLHNIPAKCCQCCDTLLWCDPCRPSSLLFFMKWLCRP